MPDHLPPAVADGRAETPPTPAEQAIVTFITEQTRRAYAEGARRFVFSRPDHTTATVTFGPAEPAPMLIEE